MAKTHRVKGAAGQSGAGQLRIVAGKWRRRLLPVAAVEGLRPTAERIRETLFNWLAPVIDGAHCLDLCAGTGALGFEALSRGAGSAVLVDNSRTAVQALQQAATLLEATDCTIVKADALQWLAAEVVRPFDIVFVDPPYAAGVLADLCRLLEQRGWLAGDALIYLEHDRRQLWPAVPDNWRTLKDKTAGNVRYQLLTVRAAS
ncbi:MAG: 16S rRNA (guanine(966)-N(2))-methyltransferase RsmD [Woeseia sp.]